MIALINVDFPTPDDPSSAPVRPAPRYSCTISMLCTVASCVTSRFGLAAIACTGVPGALAAISAMRPGRSSATSALLNRMTGDAPLSYDISR
jgi:hypothetical protein